VNKANRALTGCAEVFSPFTESLGAAKVRLSCVSQETLNSVGRH